MGEVQIDEPVTERQDATRRLKILIFIESDVVVRHFIDSGAFEVLVRRHDITFVSPPSGYARITRTADHWGLDAHHAFVDLHRKRYWYSKTLFLAKQMGWRPGADWRRLRAFRAYMSSLLPSTKVRLFYRILGMPGVYDLFRTFVRWRLSIMPNKEMEDLIVRERPDLLVHPTVLDGYYLNDLVVYSKTHGVPLVALMNSWDNPSIKRTVLGQIDRLLVWGEQTEDHAVEFMRMAPEHIVRFGAAQFDVYRDPPRLSRENFCSRHGIDPGLRIFLYAGSSKAVNEFEDLCKLDAAVSDGQLVNTVIIYRPHPWGRGGKNGTRILGHDWQNVRIDSTMRFYLEQIRDGGDPRSYPDYRDTNDLLAVIDALVSPLSTIILEAAILGKPVLCYLPTEVTGSSIDRQSGLVHFQAMYNIPEISLAYGQTQLVDAASALLDKVGDSAFASRLRQRMEYFIEPFEKPYSERLATYLEGLAVECATRHVAPSLGHERQAGRTHP